MIDFLLGGALASLIWAAWMRSYLHRFNVEVAARAAVIERERVAAIFDKPAARREEG